MLKLCLYHSPVLCIKRNSHSHCPLSAVCYGDRSGSRAHLERHPTVTRAAFVHSSILVQSHRCPYL
jgi:hypothetical protein